MIKTTFYIPHLTNFCLGFYRFDRSNHSETIFYIQVSKWTNLLKFVFQLSLVLFKSFIWSFTDYGSFLFANSPNRYISIVWWKIVFSFYISCEDGSENYPNICASDIFITCDKFLMNSFLFYLSIYSDLIFSYSFTRYYVFLFAKLFSLI